MSDKTLEKKWRYALRKIGSVTNVHQSQSLRMRVNAPVMRVQPMALQLREALAGAIRLTLITGVLPATHDLVNRFSVPANTLHIRHSGEPY